MLTKKLFEETVQAQIAIKYNWSPDEFAIEWKYSTGIARVLVDDEVTISYQLDNVNLFDLFGDTADGDYANMLAEELAARLNYLYWKYKKRGYQSVVLPDDSKPPAPGEERIQFNGTPVVKLSEDKKRVRPPMRMSFDAGCGILFHDGGEILSEPDIHFSYTGKLTIGNLKKRE